MPNRIGISLLLDEPRMERWAADAVRNATQDRKVEVTEIIINSEYNESDEESTVKQYVDYLQKNGVWAFVLGWHRLVNPPSYLEKEPLESLSFTSDAKITYCQPVPTTGLGNELPTDVIDRLKGTEIAFRRGFGIIKGEALEAPQYGILSFHHGDIRKYRGKPAAVWEYLHGESTAGITLQRITEELDGGEIVVEDTINIRDVNTWEEIKKRQFTASEEMLSVAIQRLSSSRFETYQANNLGPVFTVPGLKDTLMLTSKNLVGTLHEFLFGNYDS